MTNQNIIVIASPGRHSNHLVGCLAEHFSIACVVHEKSDWTAKLRLARRRTKRLGISKVAGQVAFSLYNRLWARRKTRDRARAILHNEAPAATIPVEVVESVKSPRLIQILDREKPDVIVVSGTSIIPRDVLRNRGTFLNIHCGITPRYRGSHGAFWAVYENRPDLAGVTIHIIDPGIDTGPIVKQATIEIEADDDVQTLAAKQYHSGTQLIIEAVRECLAGTCRPYRREDLESKLWYGPTLAEYRRFRANRDRILSAAQEMDHASRESSRAEAVHS